MKIKRMSGIIMRRNPLPPSRSLSCSGDESLRITSIAVTICYACSCIASKALLIPPNRTLPPPKKTRRNSSSHRKGRDKWMRRRHRIQQRDVQNFKSNSRHGDNGRAVDWLAAIHEELVDISLLKKLRNKQKCLCGILGLKYSGGGIFVYVEILLRFIEKVFTVNLNIP